MDVKDFYFDLPEELIAQTPLAERTASRLLVMDKQTGETSHKHFADLLDILQPSDCLVLNNTKVIPARLIGKRKDTGARIEFLLLKRREGNQWETMVHPGKKAKAGHCVVFGDNLLEATVLEVLENGNRLIAFQFDGIFEEILDKLGEMPLPPYITEKLEDRDRYQTVFAKYDGSAAAPTAGLHFTETLLEKIREKGITIAYVTLHVGIGTFRPVKVEVVEAHEMHSEYYEIEPSEAEKINVVKKSGGRIFAVGTTSCRTLESNADENGILQSGCGNTNIFIYPGYTFRLIDGLITNFHLPESTLIMLVSALAGRDHTLAAYAKAVHEKYRFFSFGDAMIIL